MKLFLGLMLSTLMILLSRYLEIPDGFVLAVICSQGLFITICYLQSRPSKSLPLGAADEAFSTLSTHDAQREYIEQLQQSLQLQQSVVAEEIERVESLINEATVTLEKSFKSIYNLTLSYYKQVTPSINLVATQSNENEGVDLTLLSEVEQFLNAGLLPDNNDNKHQKILTIVDQLDKDNQQLTQRLASLGKFSGQFKFHLDDAIRAMQFEDVANQTINAIKHQLSIFSGLNEQLQQIKAGDNLLNSDALLSCIQQCENIRQASRESTANQAVKQNTLRSGDVELF